MERVLGEFDPVSMEEKMLATPEHWNAVSSFASHEMVKKEDDERSRREEAQHGAAGLT